MTDKQIIIDGVDVSGCRFYDGEFEYSCQCSCTICERNQEDCYYKQLKRKEQECEELKDNLPNAITRLMGELDQLKEQLEAYKMEADEGKEINAELKAELKHKEQECEELKEAQKNSRCAWKSLEGTFCQEAQEQLDQLKAENDELRQFLSREPLAIQALQKSYESYQKSTKVFSDWVKDYKQLIIEIKELCKRQDLNQGSRCIHILQKISECEGNDE